jgi:hypothetical protein
MLRKIENIYNESLFQWLNRDPARNYFILLTLKKNPSIYSEIWMDENKEGIHTAIFKRKSGNLQISLSKGFEMLGIKEWLIKHDFNTLISPRSYCEPFESLLKLKKKGAEIACLKKNDYQPVEIQKRLYNLETKDLQAVEALYSSVFSGYPKVDYMKEKLLSKRGIGVYLEGMKAVAQSDFDLLIVGVATQINHQKKGCGMLVMHGLLQKMFITKEAVYLQYDDEIPKKLYYKLGFRKIDQVYHYEKR